MAAPPTTQPQPIIQYIDRTAQFYTEDRLELSSDSKPLDMVYLPEGHFTMGAPKGELGRSDDEGPDHLVKIATPFFMGKYPITQAQWRVVAEFPEVKTELKSNPSDFKGDNRPVEQINWYESVEFCQRLAIATGRPYRLPTEAEWEYACRAGTQTPFHFGETITTDLANYRGTDMEFGDKIYSGAYGDGPHGQYREETTDVGSFSPNAFGLHDMHGNVWEWCQDNWHDSYQGAPEDGSAWGKEPDSEHVLRGGSWYGSPENCRSAYRVRNYPVNRDVNIGLRVVCGVART